MTRRFLAIFLCVLLLAVSGSAHTDTTLSSATCPGTGCQTTTLSGAGNVIVQVTGTFVGILVFEASVDATNYTSVLMNSMAGAGVASTQTTGLWNAGKPASNKGVPMSEEQKNKCRKPRSAEGRVAIQAAVVARESRRQQGIGYQLSDAQVETKTKALKNSWASMSEEQRAARLAGLAYARANRTPEQTARKSASLKLAWAARKRVA